MKERPVYTVDLLGEPGMSVQTKNIEIIRGSREIHIVGASIGGWTAMNLARYYLERIVSIICLILSLYLHRYP